MNDSEKLAATGEPVLVWTKATKVNIIRMNHWCEGQTEIHPKSLLGIARVKKFNSDI